MRLPASAEKEVWSILDLELARGTPFAPGQVYQGCDIQVDRASVEVKVNHIVVKRRQLDWVLNTIRAEDYDLFPHIKLMKDENALELELRPSISEPGPKRLRLHRLRSMTAVTAMVSVLLLLGLLHWRQSTALSELSLRTESTKERAMIVRTKLSELERDIEIFSALRETYEQRPSIITILRELTQLLPDGGWLTELNIEPDAIVLTGHAKSSVDILVAFEASPLFGKAHFTSPVIRAPGDLVERFSIRLELQSSGKLSLLEHNKP
jgi:general secretion pathway protein L